MTELDRNMLINNRFSEFVKPWSGGLCEFLTINFHVEQVECSTCYVCMFENFNWFILSDSKPLYKYLKTVMEVV